MIDLSKRPFSVQLIVWMLLGPFFLVAMLSALLAQSPEGSFVVSLIAISGLLSCWVWRLKGFVLAGVALVLTIFVLDPASLWASACYALPILAALLLTALCMQEAHGLILKRERNVHELNQVKNGLEHERKEATLFKARLVEENRVLKDQLGDQQRWNRSIKKLMEVGEHETARLAQLRQNYLEKLSRYERQIQELTTRVHQLQDSTSTMDSGAAAASRELLNQLNDLRVRHYQMEILASQYRDQLKGLKPKLQMLAHLKADNIHLQHEVEALKNQADTTDAFVDLKKENVSLKRDLQGLTSTIDALTKQLNEQQDQSEMIKALKAELKKQSNPVDETKIESGRLKQLKNQLEQKDKALLQARADLFKAQGLIDSLRHHSNEQVHEINEEMHYLCQYAEMLEQEITSIDAMNKELLLLVGQREDFAATGSDQ